MDFQQYNGLILLCLFTLMLQPVCNESVNKDKQTKSGSSLDVLTTNPHADLPTKFGDEDDVIKLKQQQQQQPADKVGASSTAVAGGTSVSDKPSKNDGNKKHDFDDFNFDSDEDEHYDEDEEDFILSEHFPDKDESDDSEYKNADYEEEGELGPTLDNFGAKLDGDTGDELPVFLTEPQNTYVIRSRQAILTCKAAHALKVRD